MKKRVFFNPAINDTATFIATAEETDGAYTLLEIELFRSEGPPLHYHNAFTENFECVAGVLHLQIGKKKMTLNPGESVIVPRSTPHRFYNDSDERVVFRITFRPGHAGMENFIKIIYSLAEDGLTDKKGKPNDFSHLACILVMSDSNAAGFMSLLSPIIHLVAKRARKNGTEAWLLNKYCQ